uniref:Protein kinase domain-containing protein n=1 Tax=Gopherus evgoodei TaxID=1825980 RepID=A0A8C4VUL6_9SAUR
MEAQDPKQFSIKFVEFDHDYVLSAVCSSASVLRFHFLLSPTHFVCTGTFGRVHLVKEKMAKRYFALKVMSIPDVIRLKQEQHVHNEKSVLKEVNHPFLIRLFWTYHDERFLYMLMEYVPGGELFSYLRNMGRFNNSTGLFYSAEIICAIEYLHSKEILTDFGFAKKLVDRTWTLCGTPEYLAPEVIQSKGHGRAVDWWALGILIFEMLSGFPPFFDDNPFGIYQKILAGKIDFPRHLDLYVKDLIKKLLVVDRTRRLGNMKNGADDVKRHRWFRSTDWDAVPQRKLKRNKCYVKYTNFEDAHLSSFAGKTSSVSF